MNKKARITTISALVFAVAVIALVVYAAPKKCNNGIDDDNDGLIDLADPGCSSPNDNTETSASLVCDDGLDASNDRDTLADYRLSGGDPGCSSPTDTSEIDGQCDDSLDDAADADTLSDASDPGCTSTSDASEVDGQCDDLADNDGDTYTDYPNDPGCTAFSDSSELGTAQCDDNIDNDFDSFIDYPDDSGCSSPTDNLESTDSCTDSDGGFVVTTQGSASGQNNNSGYNYTDVCIDAVVLDEHTCSGTQPVHTNYNCNGNFTGCSNGKCVYACNDGADNDNDGLIDYPNDPGCSSSTDTTETSSSLVCDNGIDETNDADTLADYRLSGGDPGCTSPTDNNERDGPCDDNTDNDGDGFTDYSADPECANFADVEQDCTDTDGGKVYTIQGTTSGSYGGTPFSGTDVCIDSTTLTEYYCNPFNLGSENVNCAMNQTTSCSNGACV